MHPWTADLLKGFLVEISAALLRKSKEFVSPIAPPPFFRFRCRLTVVEPSRITPPEPCRNPVFVML